MVPSKRASNFGNVFYAFYNKYYLFSSFLPDPISVQGSDEFKRITSFPLIKFLWFIFVILGVGEVDLWIDFLEKWLFDLCYIAKQSFGNSPD